MSGSDPSVRSTGGAGGGQDDCIQRFETVLASPVPHVVSELTVGELLDVVSIDSPVRGVVTKRLIGDLVGAITRDILTLRRCIERGVPYEAEVLRIAGGSVTVEVRQQ